MSSKQQIQGLKELFQKSRNSPRREDGRIADRKLYNTIGEALIIVGKEDIYELAEEIYPFLNDPFPEFRAEAVKTLGWSSRLGIKEFCKDQAYKIWESDPDEDVKIAAIGAWGDYYARTKNPDVLKKLYNITTSLEYSSEIRAWALEGLFEVADAWKNPREGYDILDLGDYKDPIEFNKVVDWNRVHHVMQECVPGWKP